MNLLVGEQDLFDLKQRVMKSRNPANVSHWIDDVTHAIQSSDMLSPDAIAIPTTHLDSMLLARTVILVPASFVEVRDELFRLFVEEIVLGDEGGFASSASDAQRVWLDWLMILPELEYLTGRLEVILRRNGKN